MWLVTPPARLPSPFRGSTASPWWSSLPDRNTRPSPLHPRRDGRESRSERGSRRHRFLQVLDKKGFKDIALRKDLSGKARMVKAVQGSKE